MPKPQQNPNQPQKRPYEQEVEQQGGGRKQPQQNPGRDSNKQPPQLDNSEARGARR